MSGESWASDMEAAILRHEAEDRAAGRTVYPPGYQASGEPWGSRPQDVKQTGGRDISGSFDSGVDVWTPLGIRTFPDAASADEFMRQRQAQIEMIGENIIPVLLGIGTAATVGYALRHPAEAQQIYDALQKITQPAIDLGRGAMDMTAGVAQGIGEMIPL